MKKKGAEIIIETLEKLGITKVAGIPGGSNLPLYDALSKSKKITHILARHEQGAGFMAQGIARTTGKAGVCIATSGPGVTNLLTAIADAKLDSIPLIAITGQVSTSLIGTDAFQEVDSYGLSLPITKHNFFVKTAGELESVIYQAFEIAESGRPGPVLIDVPKDVQNEIIDFEPKNIEKQNFSPSFSDESLIKKAALRINASKRPILYIGGGVISSGASEKLRLLAEKSSIPIVSTLMGLGAIPHAHPLYHGMSGMHGAPYVNYMMEETDLLLVFGARLNDRATGKVDAFSRKAAIIHFDIDQAEIDKIKKSDLFLTGDFNELIEKISVYLLPDKRKQWLNEIQSLKEEHPMPLPESPFHPVSLMKRIGASLPEDTIIATDVGQHQMWAAQHYPFQRPRTFLTSGGLGTMGFGLPTAIGAALANPDKKVILFTGDGSFLMNIQELAVLKELNLNLSIILLNNQQLGLVRQQQEFFFNKNYFASKFHYTPDFESIGKSFGIKSFKISDEGEFKNHFGKISASREPLLIEIMTNPHENVLPIVPPGKANSEMIRSNP